MRPIKFRAWNKKINKMQEWVYPHWDYVCIPNIIPIPLAKQYPLWATHEDGFESEKYMCLMQFTWRTDTSKNEIYDSDIIQWNCNRSINNWLVYWANDWWWIKDSRWGNKTHLSHASWLKVIWNIYENPELLNKQL